MTYLLFTGPGANWRTWLRWGLLLLGAGLMPGGCTSFPGGGGGGGGEGEGTGLAGTDLDTSTIVLLVAGAVLLGLLIGLVVSYFISRLRVVVLDGVLHGEPRVRGTWSRTAKVGLGYFLAQLVGHAAVLAGVAASLLLALPSLRSVVATGDVRPADVALFLLLGLAVILPLALANAVYQWFLYHLALPQAWLHGTDFRTGVRAASGLARSRPGAHGALFLVYVPVVIGGGILAAIVSCCAGCLFAIPGVPVVVLLYVGFAKAWPALLLGIPLGLLWIVGLAWLASTVTAPVPLFFRAWTLAFVGRIDPRLAVGDASPPPDQGPGTADR